jgi:hypothetical protein
MKSETIQFTKNIYTRDAIIKASDDFKTNLKIDLIEDNNDYYHIHFKLIPNSKQLKQLSVDDFKNMALYYSIDQANGKSNDTNL